MIAAVLDHYCDHRGDDRASSFQARRAVEIVGQFLIEKNQATAKVASFGPLAQRDFARWCHDSLGHAPATIARNLSVVSAAFHFAASLQRVNDGFGNEAEAILLDHHPRVLTDKNKVAEALSLPDPLPRDWLIGQLQSARAQTERQTSADDPPHDQSSPLAQILE